VSIRGSPAVSLLFLVGEVLKHGNIPWRKFLIVVTVIKIKEFAVG
jgi:hypothetical protein